MKTFKPSRIMALGALTLAAGLAGSALHAEQFTVAVIPDTQNYCDTASPGTSPQPASTQMYQREMQYLADQKSLRNIVFVTHVGDVVQHGDLYDGEWQNAKSAMDILAASGIPFGMTPGNHDYDNYSHATGSRPLAGSTKWNQYFGPASAYFSGKSWFGGSFTDPSSLGISSYETFAAGGKTFLHISLEMEASDATLSWAAGIISSHPDMPTVVTTHEYLSYQNDVTGKAIRLSDGYMVGEPNNQCQAVWDKFISQNDQIFLVICGHNWSSTVGGISDGENLRVDNNAFGHPVYQVLSDYQGNTFDTTGAAGALTGGAGWLRLMTFDTETRLIHFQTYSSELHEYAGVPGGPTFNLPASFSDFILPIPDRVFGPWKFGITSDTQWTVADDGKNPNTVAANIIKQVDQQFINANVKLVVAVGDMVDTGSQANDYVRALYAQDLYNAGIGFYPTRGNHEAANGTYTGSGADFRHAYPQILPGATAGLNGDTPPDITTALISPAVDLLNNPPAAATNAAFVVGGDFSAPTAANLANDSVSYAFDYHNATFMLLDQFQSPDYYTSHLPEQMGWISSTLAGRTANTHAFVFTHKNMLGGNHKDNMFGGQVTAADPGDGYGVDYNSLAPADQAAMTAKVNLENGFLACLQSNNVKYVISGHDHHHYRSIVTSPDQQSSAHQLICASDSSKFYVPATPVSGNDLPLEQELFRVGYYLFTLDGPQATIDYYADTATNNYSGPFNFVKRSSTGYSLNGQEFVVPEGTPYTVVADNTAKALANGESGYFFTAMKILSGVNASTAANNYGKPQSEAINTGWSRNYLGLASDILTLWGLTDVGSSQTATFTLSLTYNPTNLTIAQIQSGSFGLVSQDTNGNWANAVLLNHGGTPLFVLGAYNGSYPLGTYGVDTVGKTVWAVLNHQGRFAAAVAQLNQAPVLANPAGGATITNGFPLLNWSPIAGATGYVVTVVGPKGANIYSAAGASLLLSSAQNGAYSWTVTPVNSAGPGLVSAAGSFNVSFGVWKFGVMSDNQWTGTPDDGFNPSTVPADIIKQVDAEFIAQGVKLVLDVGDSVDVGTNGAIDTTAVFRQDLYNAGIGFYPVRGNHEASVPGSGTEWARVFPQMFNGVNNQTPADAFTVPNPDAATQPYPAKAGLPFTVGANFSQPTAINTASNAVTYSFDYNNTRFVLVDQFGNLGEENNCSSIPALQPWITQQLADQARPPHAFVIGHKNLLGGNHKDNLFGNHTDPNDPGDADPTQWPAQNAFINSLATNQVHYYISGHDHHHYESVVTCPDGSAKVHQIISASDSSKFYTPHTPVSTNDTPISQDLYKIGCYIYTVDGPRVTVDYYGVPSGQVGGILPTAAPGAHATPALTGNWEKIASFGYSLNGREFFVPEGGSYTVVADNTTNAVARGESGYLGTTLQIVAGRNNSTTTNNYGKPHAKAVDTGWAPANGTISDILTLWGTGDIGTNQNDTVALSLTYNSGLVTPAQLANGSVALVSPDAGGQWVNAATLNAGGNPQFVFGPYCTNYTLGTYGVDTNAGTVWAVVNYNGQFAAGTVVRRPNPGSVRIATLSDIHYFATNLLIADGSAFQAYLAQDRKLLAQSAAIAKAALDAVIAQQPDIILISGDLTKDGELDSHLGVSNLLAHAAGCGAQVYVIPGNHDVNNTNAMSFNGAVTTPVPNITPAQFSSIYAPFGYNQAVAKDPSSLSYVVEPVAGLWILCMDSAQYAAGQDPTAGSFPPQRLSWITNELAYAQAHGKVVIGMMHHGLMEHFVGEKALFPQYVLDNYQTVGPLFAGYGLKVVLTGHFHAQDAVAGTFNGNTIYDIETGSTVTYPCPYRLMDLQPDGQLAINSHRITSINYNLGNAPDFQTYAYSFLTNGMLGLSTAMLQAPPFSLDQTTAGYLAPAVTEGMVDHYVGDEPGLAGATPATQTIINGLLAGAPQQQQLGGAILSLFTDLPPADNNLTLGLTVATLAGPGNGVTISNAPAVLTWSPVWSANIYHVTVVSGSFSENFDTIGNSLVLPLNLPNGAYTWTVTPDNGTVSGTGNFALDLPPALAIAGPDGNGFLHVSWPTSGQSGYQLQFSPDLKGTNWVPVSTNGFFRLVRP